MSQDEFIARNSALKQFHTGPDGENPAEAPAIEEETQAPAPKQAGTQRSTRSKASAKAAVADALGVSADAEVLEDIEANPAEDALPDLDIENEEPIS